jgi:hypothetical protein
MNEVKFEALVELSRKVEGNESQVSEAKLAETCWTNYPRSEATRDYPLCEFKWYHSELSNLFSKLASGY